MGLTRFFVVMMVIQIGDYILLKQGNLVEYFRFSKGWLRWPSRSFGKLTKNIMFSFLRYFGINPYFLKK